MGSAPCRARRPLRGSTATRRRNAPSIRQASPQPPWTQRSCPPLSRRLPQEARPTKPTRAINNPARRGVRRQAHRPPPTLPRALRSPCRWGRMATAVPRKTPPPGRSMSHGGKAATRTPPTATNQGHALRRKCRRVALQRGTRGKPRGALPKAADGPLRPTQHQPALLPASLPAAPTMDPTIRRRRRRHTQALRFERQRRIPRWLLRPCSTQRRWPPPKGLFEAAPWRASPPRCDAETHEAVFL
mmetsp:Transcript_66769/g.186224  ORF Transcript_66769/g.186224 Transcript_66769/m.186224 type:complete len:244 (+) Transcript_66769:2399-3130(+)